MHFTKIILYALNTCVFFNTIFPLSYPAPIKSFTLFLALFDLPLHLVLYTKPTLLKLLEYIYEMLLVTTANSTKLRIYYPGRCIKSVTCARWAAVMDSMLNEILWTCARAV